MTHTEIRGGEIADQYRSLIAKSRYSRWIEEYGRRETWAETVNRYVDFIAAKGDLTPDEKAHLRYNVLNHRVMPSMRLLMTAGEAAERSNMAIFNPVAGSTPVLVRGRGMVPIEKLVDSDAQVLNVDGRWADAAFRSYGVQETFCVNVRKNKTSERQTVRATANHRWILSDGTVLPTEGLKPGDRLAYATAPRPETDNIDYELGVIHGLVYGDGTMTYSQQRVNGYVIRLCGSSRELLPVFRNHGTVTYSPTSGGDPLVMLYGSFAKTHSLKSLPSETETESYLLGFLRGWLAADGSVSVGGQSVLCATEEGYEWFVNNAGLVGILSTGFQELPSTTNFGDRKRRTLSIRLDRESMVPEDFIISSKRERFQANTIGRFYVVESVESSGMEEEVFCAEVPDTNTFVLSGGLVTGNCSFVAVDDLRAFDEALYILMNGVGLGFSVKKEEVEKLPTVPAVVTPSDEVIVVHDSKEGWAQSYRELVASLWRGELPKWDLRQLRPQGARLRTFGGRSSGPEPLNELFEFTVKSVLSARGRKLTTLEAHEIMTKVGSIVVVGGVRRSALISLSSLDDDLIRDAKSGNWWEAKPHLALANNSAVYDRKPTKEVFDAEWAALVASGSGERGIFNLAGAKKHAPRRRNKSLLSGTNPCGEIVLRSSGVCNLTEVIVRAEDSLDDLREKVSLASKMGTWQASLTNFPYVRDIWRHNAEEEALLGVSMTGTEGHTVLNGSEGREKQGEWLEELRKLAVSVNRREAKRIGINSAAAVTTVKPSGTVSQLTGTSSGLHTWYDDFYLRRIRMSSTDPICKFLEDAGIESEVDFYNDRAKVFSFPFAAPKGAATRNDRDAIEQLENWLVFKEHWTEHNPSVTISVGADEWEIVGEWVYEHFDRITGLSFLPKEDEDHTYVQAPYESITKEQYEELASKMPEVNWDFLSLYEQEDNTTGSQELACVAGECSVDNLIAEADMVEQRVT